MSISCNIGTNLACMLKLHLLLHVLLLHLRGMDENMDKSMRASCLMDESRQVAAAIGNHEKSRRAKSKGAGSDQARAGSREHSRKQERQDTSKTRLREIISRHLLRVLHHHRLSFTLKGSQQSARQIKQEENSREEAREVGVGGRRQEGRKAVRLST